MINDSTMTTTINQSLCNAFYLMRLPIELYDSINQSINQSCQVVGFAADERYRQGRDLQYADVYHSATRYGTGENHVPIVLPRSTLWTFNRQRLVLGRESLALQGHTVNPYLIGAVKVSEGQLQDLAGNSFLGIK